MLQSSVKSSLSAVLLALLLAACGGARAQVSSEDLKRDSIDEVRSTLVAAEAIASDYGQRYLGHYVDLTVAELAPKGLTVPEGVSIQLKTGHTGYCFIATSEVLPAEHPWATATMTNVMQEPSAEDRCPKR